MTPCQFFIIVKTILTFYFKFIFLETQIKDKIVFGKWLKENL